MTTANEIADKMATEQNLTKAQAKTVFDGIFKAIADAATSGAETSIPGFGKFKVKANARARRPRSVNRRHDQDRGLEETDLHASQGHQGRLERLNRSWLMGERASGPFPIPT